MKKSTEELILSEIIKINTVLVRIQSDILEIREVLNSHDKLIHEGFKETNRRFDIVDSRLDNLEFAAHETGRFFHLHDNRLTKLEKIAA